MEKSNLKKSVYNVVFGLLNQIITIVVGIVVPRLVLVELGSEANGLMNSVSQVLAYLALFEGGIGVSITKALYSAVAQKDKIDINGIMSTANVFFKKVGRMYLWGIATIAVFYPLFIKSTISRSTIIVFILLSGLPPAINFLFQGKYRVFLQVDGKSYVLTNLTTVIYLCTSICKIFLLLKGCGIVALQTMYLFFELGQMIFIIWYMKRNYSWLNVCTEPKQGVLVQRKAVFLHQISNFIFNNTDVLLISWFGDLKLVSVYAMYNMFYTMISTFIAKFTGSVTFVMGQEYNLNRTRFLKMQKTFDTFNMTISFVLYFVLFQCILPFLKLYTEGVTDISYIDVYLPVLFMLVQLLQAGRFSAQKVIEYDGKFEETRMHALLEAVVNVGVSVLGIKLWGIHGVLLGTIVALVIRSVLMIYYANKKILNVSQGTIYKKWWVNFLVFGVLNRICKMMPISLNTYLEILLYACVLSVVSLLIYTGVAFLIDKEAFAFAREILRPYVKKYIKKEIK